MTNFEKVTASPEALGQFLAALSVAGGPWEEAFHRTFCDGCRAENCDAENCPHNAERSNPLWWLVQTAAYTEALAALRAQLDPAKLDLSRWKRCSQCKPGGQLSLDADCEWSCCPYCGRPLI